MITIRLEGREHMFPEVDFADVEVIEACRNIMNISLDYQNRYPFGEDVETVLAFLKDYGHELMEQLDYALGEGACMKMFGNRMNIEKLRTVAEQVTDGIKETWGNIHPAEHGYRQPVHGKKTGGKSTVYCCAER